MSQNIALVPKKVSKIIFVLRVMEVEFLNLPDNHEKVTEYLDVSGKRHCCEIIHDVES